MNATVDVLIVGGGPAGLQAALSLGRARKRVVLCDAGPRRNAAAKGVNNFVTRDGIPPEEFRREARAQLAKYPNVVLRDLGVARIGGARGAFEVTLSDGVAFRARRVVLATGMIDQPPPLEGLAPLWGHFVFQCPYCHGWEIKDGRWGYLAPDGVPAPHLVPFVMQMRGWSRDVTLFARALPDDVAATLRAAGVRLETGAVTRLVGGNRLEAVALADGTQVPCDALFMHPPQAQVPLVRALGLALDDDGFVKTDPMTRETSVPGIYAAGDLATRLQAAVLASAAGMQAAAMLNAELSAELAVSGGEMPERSPGPARAHHPGDWSHLDEPSRATWQEPARVIAALDLFDGAVVADVGAGTGYFTELLSRAVGPSGRVLALDVDPKLVGHVKHRHAALGNVEARVIRPDAPQLDAVDRILSVDVWHHLPDRLAAARRLHAALKPGGRLVVVDHLSRSSPESVVAELREAGFTDLRVTPLPRQFIVAARAATPPASFRARAGTSE